MKEIRSVSSEQIEEVDGTVEYCHGCAIVKIKEVDLRMVAALKVAMKNLATKYGCSAIAIQCWTALQDEIGIMPCAANAMLIDEGIPVVCETDIHGAISCLLIEAANLGRNKSFSLIGLLDIQIMRMVNCYNIVDCFRFLLQKINRQLAIR